MRFITLFLCCALFGCSTAHHAVCQTNPSPLFLYWGSEDSGSANRFLSAQIHLDEEIFIGGEDFLNLRGHVERRGSNLFANLMGSTGQQGQFYRGNIQMEKPFFAQGGVASGGFGPSDWFLVSTNLDCRTVLEHVNAVRGLTNAPFNHSAARIPMPQPISNAPEDINPYTGLPWGNNKSVDPITGLPILTAKEMLAVQISSILKECESIKPGMRRATLLHVFTTEGGLSTQKRRTFVNNRCPCIKIDVEFAPTESKQERATDIITKITKPYLAWSIGD